jgi:S-adenosylmethionine synthetase
VIVAIQPQSEDIAIGVDKSLEIREEGGAHDPFDETGAGDQGMMIGFACRDTEELMPMPIAVAHRLAKRLSDVRRAGVLPYLRPDGKSQVTIEYEDGRPVGVQTVVISAQHKEDVDIESLLAPDVREHVIEPILAEVGLPHEGKRVLVNPTGRFEIGGPKADTGLTGRKIMVDSYGSMAPHGGGCFSGKDPTKVDRSAAYMGRYVAKNVVASGVADRVQLQVAYAIGTAHPVSLSIDTFGTHRVDPAKLEAVVREAFDFRPAAIIQTLDLRRPIYRETAAYGHFGRKGFSWEETDRADDIRGAFE